MSSFTNFKLSLAISLFLAWFCFRNFIEARIQSRIVNGTETTIANNQYLVSLLINNGTTLICGGSLIKPQHVVTAAHCVIDYRPRNLTVRGGSSFYNRGGFLRQVIRIARPRLYDNITLNMDVAALKLRRPMTGANITTISICSSIMHPGNSSKVSGWGKISEANNVLPVQMRTINLPIISTARCKRRYALLPDINITVNMFCANDLIVRGTCDGDSGSPLVYNGQLCGITSFGTLCNESYPNVFTRVNARLVKGFILRQTNDTI